MSDTVGIAERWREYFQILLNRPTTQQQTQVVYQLAEQMIEPPSYEDVTAAIQNRKQNKLPGEDNIPTELIQSVGADLWHRQHQIIDKLWKEEKLPEDWLMGLMIPIFKKGARVECKNYQGICLLNV